MRIISGGGLTPLQRGLAGVSIDLDFANSENPFEREVIICRLFIGVLYVLLDEIKRSGGLETFVALFNNSVALENFLVNSESFKSIGSPAYTSGRSKRFVSIGVFETSII